MSKTAKLSKNFNSKETHCNIDEVFQQELLKAQLNRNNLSTADPVGFKRFKNKKKLGGGVNLQDLTGLNSSQNIESRSTSKYNANFERSGLQSRGGPMSNDF